MDEQRLTEMERDYINLNLNESISDEERAALAHKVLESHHDLIEEVRRLQAWQRDMVAWVEEMHAKYPVQH